MIGAHILIQPLTNIKSSLMSVIGSRLSLLFVSTILFLFAEASNLKVAIGEMSIELQQCPNVLYAGEQGYVIYTLRNAGSEELEVLNIEAILDGNRGNIQNSSSFTFQGDASSLRIDPYSRQELRGLFISEKETVHYVEPRVSYSLSLDDSSTNSSTAIGQQCEVRVVPVDYDYDATGYQDILDILSASSPISILLLAPIGGVIAYLLQRKFASQDFERQQTIQHRNQLYQQTIQHRNLLLERAQAVATKYYHPLVKFASECARSIGIARHSNQKDIENAYYFLSLFLTKYLEFERETGAVFIFLSEDSKGFVNEQPLGRAVGNIRAIMRSLPFDRADIVQIANSMDSDPASFKEPEFDDDTFRTFDNWISSSYCERSRLNLLCRMREFGTIVNFEAAKITGPTYFVMFSRQETEHKETAHKPSLPDRIEQDIEFFITDVSPKYISPGSNVIVKGKGFADNFFQKESDPGQYVPYTYNHKFKIGGSDILTSRVIDNSTIELSIPGNIKPGCYDIFATYRAKTEGGDSIQSTVSVPISIV